MDFSVPRNRSVNELLSQASSEDLNVLADLITDHGKGRLALDTGIKAIILRRKADGSLQSIADVLESEVCAFGGNTLVNKFRSSGIEYQELVRDVAKKMGGKISDGSDTYALEELAIAGALSKYSADDVAAISAGGTALYAAIDKVVQLQVENSGTFLGMATAGGASAASAVGTQTAASIGTTVAGALTGRALFFISGPAAVGAAGYSIYEATGPAFRITVPAVLQIAKIRRKRIDSDFQHYSERLKACL